MDFLMIIVYKYLNPHVRVILMSATIDSEKVCIWKNHFSLFIKCDLYFFQFAKYFQIPNVGSRIPTVAPIIKLNLERNFPVDTYYIDELEDVVCVCFWHYDIF